MTDGKIINKGINNKGIICIKKPIQLEWIWFLYMT